MFFSADAAEQCESGSRDWVDPTAFYLRFGTACVECLDATVYHCHRAYVHMKRPSAIPKDTNVYLFREGCFPAWEVRTHPAHDVTSIHQSIHCHVNNTI